MECVLRVSGHHDTFVVLDTEVLHDELASLDAVLSHIEKENALGVEIFVKDDRVETHILVDKAFELVGGDFAKTFESSDFGVANGVECLNALLVGVAIDGFLFVTNAEKRGLQDVDMASAHQLGVEFEEEGE